MKIHYLRHSEIDKEKWDAAVDQTVNGQTYAYSWYLDIMAGNWDALVTEDYACIMPLPWNAKWLGIRQIYQPAFIQQLGIYGKTLPDEDLIKKFLASIPAHFRYVLLQLNEQNALNEARDYSIVPRTNMLLDLSEDYETLHRNFRKSFRYCIRQAKKKELTFAVNRVTPAELAKRYRIHINSKVGLSEKTIIKMTELMQTAVRLEKGNIYSAHFADDSFASGIFFAESHGRISQLFGVSAPAGQQAKAKHYLINEVIRSKAGTKTVYDFEGSEIPAIAKFFRGFSPAEVQYYQIIRDDFPWWVKILQQVRKRF